jgi:hypothetical protein
MGLRPLISGLIMIVIFSFCLVTFAIIFITQNNPESEIAYDESLNRFQSSLSGNASAFKEMQESTSALLSSDDPSATDYLFLIFKSAFYIPKTLFSLVGSTITLFFSFIFEQLGGGEANNPLFVVFIMVNAIIIITAILYVIKAIRSGEVER